MKGVSSFEPILESLQLRVLGFVLVALRQVAVLQAISAEVVL
jgi:hypothetical protein